jgi:hypothetical protein
VNPDTPLVVREGDAARLLSVSVAALRRWRRERRGPPFVRLERCVGYRMTDLDAFVASNTVAPTPTPEVEGTPPEGNVPPKEECNGR